MIPVLVDLAVLLAVVGLIVQVQARGELARSVGRRLGFYAFAPLVAAWLIAPTPDWLVHGVLTLLH